MGPRPQLHPTLTPAPIHSGAFSQNAMTESAHWLVGPGYRVVPEFLNMYEETIERHVRGELGGKIAVVTKNGSTTFQELHDLASTTASAFASFGLTRGDRVLVLGRNTLPTITSILAAMKLGVVPVVGNSALPVADIDYILENSGARVVLAMNERIESLVQFRRAGRIDRLLSLDGVNTAADGNFGDLARGDVSFPTARTLAVDPAFMLYSSGTTGRPKGIVHGHKWVVAVGDPSILQMEFGQNDVVCTLGEFSFMGNFGHAFIFPLYAGSGIALFSERVTPASVLDFFSAVRPTILLSVPTFYRTMLASNEFLGGIENHSFRFMISTGEPLGAAVWTRWQHETGITIYEIYGVSEYQTILGNGPSLPVKPGSIGKPAPGVDVALLDGYLNTVAPGVSGVFAIRRSDPGLFLEYYRQPERWRAQHRGDWYFTGDVMQVDEDGYYYYLGRQDDLFKSRGYLISPPEIENVLQRNPVVAEVAVIPRPDERIGNSIVACVVLKPGSEPDQTLTESLMLLAKENLTPYKVPQHIEFVSVLPKSPVGKIVRRLLR
jgi:acetyl-CoA synthetase